MQLRSSFAIAEEEQQIDVNCSRCMILTPRRFPRGEGEPQVDYPGHFRRPVFLVVMSQVLERSQLTTSTSCQSSLKKVQ